MGGALLVEGKVGGEPIGLRGHDEVITVQAANLVRPPGNCDTTPLRENGRMMAFGLGERANFVRERELRRSSCNERHAPVGNSVARHGLPMGDLWREFGDLLVGYSRRIGATGGISILVTYSYHEYRPVTGAKLAPVPLGVNFPSLPGRF